MLYPSRNEAVPVPEIGLYVDGIRHARLSFCLAVIVWNMETARAAIE